MSINSSTNDGAHRESFAAIVVAYRSSARLPDCLAGLRQAGASRIVVIDNSNEPASRRATMEFADSSACDVTYRASTTNLGYGAAVNLGARQALASNWLAIVGPDVILTKDLAPLIAEARERHAALIAGLLTPSDARDGLNVRPRFSPIREFARAAVGTRRSNRLVLPDDRSSRRVPQLDGCFLLVSRATFAALHGFDEQFELYFEDVDFCRRADTLGGCWVRLERYGRHIGGASRDTAPGPAYITFRISRIRFLRKWHGALGTGTAAVITIVEFLARSLARRPEGDRIRLASLRAQLAELLRPQSVQGLPSVPHAVGQRPLPPAAESTS